MTADLLALHIANGRAEARRIIAQPERHGEQRLRIAWAALTGMPAHPRRTHAQPNMGAPTPQPGWHLLAEVIESGSRPWEANDA